MNAIKRLILLFILAASVLNLKSQDSLLVRVIGKFKKNEFFKFYCDSNRVYNIYSPKTSDNQFALFFYILLPENIKDGDQIPLSIYRKKGRWGNYRSVNFYAVYQKDIKYFVLYRSYRQKNRYCFSYLWLNTPYPEYEEKLFWSENPPKGKLLHYSYSR